MVEQTYVETLDCPQLNGVRPIEEILDGYRAVGQFDPRRWLLVRHTGGDVGCLLLAEHLGRIWELVYMGVAESRPAGGGGDWRSGGMLSGWARAGPVRKHLVLAVDAQNEPAIRAYAARGNARRVGAARGVAAKIL